MNLWIAVAIALVCASGCTGVSAIRTVAATCDTDLKPFFECRRSLMEHNRQYDLGFVEFDDQGWLYRLTDGKTPIDPIANIKHWIEQQFREENRDLVIYVFVHGWKHNAAWDDGNLQSFRELLKGVAHAEDASGTKRKVLGIYVGWRGLGVQIPLLKELTLYTRRTSATHVALGTARELFATLRDLQERRNGAAAAPRRTRLIFVGHSLGGLILYSAFSQYFVSGVEKIPFLEANQQAQSFGDMVVLINPAFEASRYEPLHRVVSQQKAFPSNQRPIFVSITAENDWATKRLHPIFRAVGTVFEEYSVDAQSRQLEVEANLNTMGHISRYRTHELGLEPTPEDAAVRSRESPKQLITQISKHVSAPRPGIWREDCERRRGFYKTYLHQGHLDKNWKWYFNGGARLQHAPGVQNMNENPDNPVWVVKAEKTIVNGHDGIFAAPFLDFLRQLYEIHDDADPGKPDCKSP